MYDILYVEYLLSYAKWWDPGWPRAGWDPRQWGDPALIYVDSEWRHDSKRINTNIFRIFGFDVFDVFWGNVL